MNKPHSEPTAALSGSEEPSGDTGDFNPTLRSRIRAVIPLHAFIKDGAPESGAYSLDEIVDRVMDAITKSDYDVATRKAEATLSTLDQFQFAGQPLLRSTHVTITELSPEVMRLPYCRAWKADGSQCDYHARFAQDGQPICGLHLGKRDTLFIPDRLAQR